MSKLVVPTKLEANFTLGDGSKGVSLFDAFSFSQNQVDNLYSYREGSKTFELCFQEHGVAYNETAASQQLAKVYLPVSGKSSVKLGFDPTPVQMWGLNFAGVVKVTPSDGSGERLIYLPGTRTYDPAGITGDPHASERIGPSCSRSQAAISLAQLVALLHGANREQVGVLQEQLRPLIRRYHGREVLFDWMLQQIQDAIFDHRDVTPYPEFIKAQMRSGKLVLSPQHEHTRSYLRSYNTGQAQPPIHYFKKVAAKDKVEDLLGGADLITFQSLLS